MVSLANTPSIALSEVVRYFDMKIIYKSSDYEKIKVIVPDVNRPGLQLVGYLDNFDSHRLQIMGKAEMHFLAERSERILARAFEDLFSLSFPALILTRDLEYFPECIEAAKAADRALLSVGLTTSELMSKLVDYLNHELAPSILRHGVLVEIHGEGVLIRGDSGIGKSETAIELVKRGHRLVADDAVEMRRISDEIHGRAPELTRHFIELRGIGVINVRQMFGVGAIRNYSEVDLVVDLEQWDENKAYDRFGLEEHTTDILGVQIPYIVVPVRPGRNLANIIEVAAMNNRQKRMGYNAAEEMLQRLDDNAAAAKAAQTAAEEGEQA